VINIFLTKSCILCSDADDVCANADILVTVKWWRTCVHRRPPCLLNPLTHVLQYACVFLLSTEINSFEVLTVV